jgi:hypothetical protein
MDEQRSRQEVVYLFDGHERKLCDMSLTVAYTYLTNPSERFLNFTVGNLFGHSSDRR